MKVESARLFDELMDILSDREWHTIEEIADELLLSVSSMKDFLVNLEDAGVLQTEGDGYERKNLVKGTSFVEEYIKLPDEYDSLDN